MKNNHFSKQSQAKQQGVVLAVALIMLVLITLLSVSAMRSTIMEERMASNSHNNNLAFQMAETALRQAEGLLNANPNALSVDKGRTQQVGGWQKVSCEVVLDSVDFYDEDNWRPPPPASAPACYYIGNADNAMSNPPQYFIEFLHAKTPQDATNPEPRECFYRITARGYGADQNSVAMLQTTYRFDGCI